jgi:hypothetical protein
VVFYALGREPMFTDQARIVGFANPVVQVIAESKGEIVYTVRSQTESFKPRVYAPGKYTIKAGKDKPDTVVAKGVEAS